MGYTHGNKWTDDLISHSFIGNSNSSASEYHPPARLDTAFVSEQSP